MRTTGLPSIGTGMLVGRMTGRPRLTEVVAIQPDIKLTDRRFGPLELSNEVGCPLGEVNARPSECRR